MVKSYKIVYPNGGLYSIGKDDVFTIIGYYFYNFTKDTAVFEYKEDCNKGVIPNTVSQQINIILKAVGVLDS